MGYESLIAALPGLKDELARERQRLREVSHRVASLERAIEGIEGLTGLRTVLIHTPFEPAHDAAPTLAGENGAMRGIAAVRAVIEEHPGRVWRAREIHDVLEQRGWISEGAQHTLRGTEAAINRLIHRGELEKVDRGRYRLRAKEGLFED